MLGIILGILWFILKILLWIILGILGLVLLLILMVLFVPIRYKVVGSKYEDINADVRVTYLLRLFRVYFHYSPGGYWYKVKVLFFTVLSENTVEDGAAEETPMARVSQPKPAEVKPVQDKPKPTQQVQTQPKPEPLKQVEAEEPPKPETPKTEAQSIKKEEVSTTVRPKETEGAESQPGSRPTASSTTQTAKPKPESPRPEKEKKKEPEPEDEGPSALDQVREIWDFLQEDQNVGVLRFILSKVFKAVGSILPKKFHAKLHLGLEDPATTAYIVGAASVLYPKVKDSLQITGEFEEQVIEGEVDIKGRIIPVIFLWTAIRLYMDGRVRRLIKEVMKMTK